MSGKKDLTIQQGATFRFTFEFDQIDKNNNQVPVDLSEATAKMQIRPNARSETIFLDLGAKGYITIPDPMNGVVEIHVPASETELLDFSSAVYDIELEFPMDDVIRLLEGRILLSYGVTR